PPSMQDVMSTVPSHALGLGRCRPSPSPSSVYVPSPWDLGRFRAPWHLRCQSVVRRVTFRGSLCFLAFCANIVILPNWGSNLSDYRDRHLETLSLPFGQSRIVQVSKNVGHRSALGTSHGEYGPNLVGSHDLVPRGSYFLGFGQ